MREEDRTDVVVEDGRPVRDRGFERAPAMHGRAEPRHDVASGAIASASLVFPVPGGPLMRSRPVYRYESPPSSSNANVTCCGTATLVLMATTYPQANCFRGVFSVAFDRAPEGRYHLLGNQLSAANPPRSSQSRMSAGMRRCCFS